jgi:hypothetical protein
MPSAYYALFGRLGWLASQSSTAWPIRAARVRPFLASSLELRQRQPGAVRVAEPCDQRAAGRGPRSHRRPGSCLRIAPTQNRPFSIAEWSGECPAPPSSAPAALPLTIIMRRVLLSGYGPIFTASYAELRLFRCAPAWQKRMYASRFDSLRLRGFAVKHFHDDSQPPSRAR